MRIKLVLRYSYLEALFYLLVVSNLFFKVFLLEAFWDVGLWERRFLKFLWAFYLSLRTFLIRSDIGNLWQKKSKSRCKLDFCVLFFNWESSVGPIVFPAYKLNQATWGIYLFLNISPMGFSLQLLAYLLPIYRYRISIFWKE